jgi:hypothetical protein
MKKLTALLSVAAVALWAVGAYAQAKPSFSGKWTMQVDPNAAPPAGGGRGGRGGGGGWGMEFTATQDATMLKIDRMQGGNPVTETFKLDGSESKNMMPGRQGGAPTEQVSKATWAGNNIEIVTTQNFGGNAIEIKRTLSIGADGALTIETVRPGQDGSPMSTKVTYKKG